MTVISALMQVDRGLIDLDAPVADYWPEFAQGGKEKLPVRYLFSHSSGLSGFEPPVTVEALYDWEKITGLLAAMEPWWEPGTQCGYHALTHGYLLGELVRRVTGKSLGTFFKEEVADPLGADFHIGLDESHDSRVGELIPPPPQPDTGFKPEPGSVLAKHNASIDFSALAPESRTRAWRAAEIPAANGHGNARSVARIASAMACGGEIDGVRLMSQATIDKALEEQIRGTDLVMMMPVRYGLGFGLLGEMMPIGPNSRTFFWGGWGGSLCIMDPDARVSYSYVMNKMYDGTTGDLRAAGPGLALRACL
jgi:CubicO group peptidase (beta-lactamase class C family)